MRCGSCLGDRALTMLAEFVRPPNHHSGHCRTIESGDCVSCSSGLHDSPVLQAISELEEQGDNEFDAIEYRRTV
ncbi:Uncharacterised protein [Mycobacteroides abscessus subsp. massiliense]|nr:Uncharacterised protein [Mycobacteroides abscessus subsp. massiliense]SKD35981.1 Uncharacterised protein [Mycobacteroides abscessus subsp. massiliense]SKD47582.1 Uncharacterised protein [Mycobacteroides abscessus subsp. massiliense]SKD50202.1 Uncharacterised protein [Mycobacteroides abscessus subsp. massiliense]SKD59460.1 Uncharacterised protein [Mycobacteroides abscessus subsp. massiliense]